MERIAQRLRNMPHYLQIDEWDGTSVEDRNI
jgi:hypothetical protein